MRRATIVAAVLINGLGAGLTYVSGDGQLLTLFLVGLALAGGALLLENLFRPRS